MISRATLSAVLVLSTCAPQAQNDPQAGTDPTRRAGNDTRVISGGVLHENLELQTAGGNRTYHFYEAIGHQANPRPLIVVLHGGYATIDAFIGKPRGAAPLAGVWLELAERENLHVAIPQAIDPGKGPHWNDCRGDCRHCGEQDDVAFLVDLVESLSQRYGVDPKRVYVCGESNGGFMTLRLAQERPDLFAAYGAVIALMPRNNTCGAPKTPASVAFVVGTEDKPVRFEGGRAALAASGSVLSARQSIAAWTTLGSCVDRPEVERLQDLDRRDDSTVTRERHACPSTGHEVLMYRVDGGGHVVPSTTERVSAAWEALVGPQNHDIQTAEELWRFFEAHPRR